jgi:carbonic anhydrase
LPTHLGCGGLRAVKQQGVIAMSKRDAYIEKMKTQLDEVNAKMDELEAKAKEAKADARAKYNEQMNKLRVQSKLAGAKLDELKAASEDGWEAMVAEMEKIRDALAHSYNYFKSQL